MPTGEKHLESIFPMSALLLLSQSQTINMAIIRTMIIHGVDHDYDDYDDYDDHDDPKHEAVLGKEDESGHLEQSFTRP